MLMGGGGWGGDWGDWGVVHISTTQSIVSRLAQDFLGPNTEPHSAGGPNLCRGQLCFSLFKAVTTSVVGTCELGEH